MIYRSIEQQPELSDDCVTDIVPTLPQQIATAKVAAWTPSKCPLCGEIWIEPTAKPLGDMRISMGDATLALGMLLEGKSIRATARLSGPR